MTFSELFRVKYRAALQAARQDDKEGTVAALKELYRIFAEQYHKDNGDAIVVKAKLSHWQDIFGGYIGIIEKHGLSDPRVRKFFGLSDNASLPSFGDLLGGAEVPAEEPAPHDGEVDIAGIVPQEPIAKDPPIVSPVPAEEPKGLQSGNGEATERKEGETVAPPAEGTTGETVAPPAYEPDCLEHFIGQQHIVKVLLKEIAIAKAEGKRHLDNILIFGNPGLGKSTLMRLIAKALGVRFEKLDCTTLSNKGDKAAVQEFLMRVASKNEPVVIAFDEIHELSKDAQSCLLNLLEEREFISPVSKGRTIRMPIEEFTFIAATTDDNDVLNTIKDRCLRLKFQMEEYTAEELAQIYRTKVAAKGLTITEEAIEACIPRSRGSVRYINSFVEGMNTELYDENGKRLSTHIDLAVALRFFEGRGIDPIGLERKDLEILRAIGEEPSGVIGAETLSARVGLDPKKYASEYEPYLVKIGFISVTGRGRSRTEKAKEYLKAE